MAHNYESQTPTSAARVSAGIVGARGYSGMELVRLLARHPNVDLVACFGSDASAKGASANVFSAADELLLPFGVSAPVSLPISQRNTLARKLDVVFLATPAEVSLELAPAFLAEGTHVIDISGAYRLDAGAYPEWYGFAHTDAVNLPRAHYGLVPFAETFTPNEKGAILVANPGCFVTAAVMALIPLIREKVILPDSIVIDAKSGTTGAGKKAAESILFSEVDGDCTPYKIGKHQHYPEILSALRRFAGTDESVMPFFSTSLLSVRTGIIASIYARLPKGKTELDVADAYRRAYGNYPLARFAHATEARARNLLSLRKTSGTPYVNLVYQVVQDDVVPENVSAPPGTGPSKLYLHAVIDNLMKGAASQAVENLNRILNLPVSTGLI